MFARLQPGCFQDVLSKETHSAGLVNACIGLCVYWVKCSSVVLFQAAMYIGRQANTMILRFSWGSQHHSATEPRLYQDICFTRLGFYCSFFCLAYIEHVLRCDKVVFLAALVAFGVGVLGLLPGPMYLHASQSQ